MIQTILKCDCCGREFSSMYWEDGYIDHVTNFEDRLNTRARVLSVGEYVDEIVRSSNDMIYRSARSIEKRLACFLSWITIDDDVKHEVEVRCRAIIDDIKASWDKVDDMYSKMTETEKQLMASKLSEYM